MSDLPDNCVTVLECRDCKCRFFRAYWNWKPAGPGAPEDGAWMLECADCRTLWLLHRDGLPNPEEIYGATADLPVPGGGRQEGDPVYHLRREP